jgi:hypothetical protein
VKRLKDDPAGKDFRDQVASIPLKLTTKLVRAALAFFAQPARKKQESRPA